MYRATRSLAVNHPGLLLLGLGGFTALWMLQRSLEPADLAANTVGVWWTVLGAVSIFNLCCWRISAAALAKRRESVEPALYQFQFRQLVLSAVYVLGCGFRSVLPRADVQRMGLIDSWMSSVMVGRTVATVAELCFMAQWALLLNIMAKSAGSRFGVVVSWLIVPFIAVAELFSWSAVLTTCYLGNAIEESIWTITAAMIIVSSLVLWSRSSSRLKPFLAAGIMLGIAYVAFMCTVDVPMYVNRFLSDEAAGREYLSFSQGLHDVWSRRFVTFDWEQWATEIPWMSLYFSVAVWASIALVHTPWCALKPHRATVSVVRA
jgi:hypothetical protein